METESKQGQMERAIISWLICGGNMQSLNPELSTRTFTSQNYRSIYKRMVDIVCDGQQINAFTLIGIDCPAFVEFENEVFLFGSPSQLSDILVELEKKRNIRKEYERLITQCDDPLSTLSNVIAASNSVHSNLESYRESRNNGVVSLRDVLSEYIQKFGKITENICTGMSYFDGYVEMRRQEYDIWGGRTSEGKSALSLWAAIRMAKQGHRGLYVSAEMTVRQQCERIFPSLTRICSEWFKMKSLNGLQMKSCIDTATNCTMPLHFVFTPGITTQQIENILESGEYDFCFTDYLQLIRTEEKLKREQEVAYISKTFQRCAKQYNIALIALAQLNRQGVDEPEISHLRESGSLEQDADKVLLIYKDQIGKLIVKVGKNRNGPKCKFSMIPIWDYYDFREGEVIA